MTKSPAKPRTLLSSIIAVAMAATPLAADTVTNQAVADTTLQEAFPDNNLGGGSTFTAGTRLMGGRTRALIEFDIAGSVPSGVTINSASLTLTVTATQSPAPNSTFALHRILADWGEGSGSDLGGGEPAGSGEASWNNRLGPGNPWDTGGGDFSSSASGTQFIEGNGTYTFTGAGLAADVQMWLDDPESNFGWLLLTEAEETLTTIRRFAGRLATTGAPMLVIDYTVGAAPSPVLENATREGGNFQFTFQAQAGNTYAVEARPLPTEGDWTAITNFAAPETDIELTVTDPLTPTNRIYRVRTP